MVASMSANKQTNSSAISFLENIGWALSHLTVSDIPARGRGLKLDHL